MSAHCTSNDFYGHACIFENMYMCVRVYINMYIYMYVYIYTYVYIYI